MKQTNITRNKELWWGYKNLYIQLAPFTLQTPFVVDAASVFCKLYHSVVHQIYERYSDNWKCCHDNYVRQNKKYWGGKALEYLSSDKIIFIDSDWIRRIWIIIINENFCIYIEENNIYMMSDNTLKQ